MRQFLSVRNAAAALAAGLAAASLSGCMDFPGPTSGPGSTGSGGGTQSDAPRRPAAKLTINEFDYDQAGADNAEFVEIVNPNAAAVDLADYRIEMINGSNGRRYGSYTPAGSLPAGGYFVIADPAVVAALPAGTAAMTLKSGGLQNGPDGIRIVEAATGRVLDGVHYRDSVPGAGEGTPAPKDATATPTSIGRCNGADSDDNGADFATMAPTPGAANACAGPVSG